MVDFKKLISLPRQQVNPDSEQFRSYYQALSKDLKKPLGEIGVTCDEKVQATIKETFSKIGKLGIGQNGTPSGTVNINGKEIKLENLEMKDIKAFVDFASKYFQSRRVQDGDYKNFVSDINNTKRAIEAKFGQNLLNKYAVHRALSGLDGVRDEIALGDVKQAAEVINKDTDETVAESEKAMKVFLHQKEEDLNNNIEIKQNHAKIEIDRARDCRKHMILKSVGIASGMALGVAFMFIPGAVILGAAILGGAMYYMGTETDFIADTEPQAAMIHKYAEQKAKLKPELYEFIRKNNIDTFELMYRAVPGQDHYDDEVKKIKGAEAKFDAVVWAFDNTSYCDKELEVRRIQLQNAQDVKDKEILNKEIKMFEEQKEKIKKELDKYMNMELE